MKRIGLFLFFCILSLHGIAQVENDKDTLIIRQDKINDWPRACLKNHFRKLQAPLCSIFCPHSVAVARYAALIRTKSPTNWDSQLAKTVFQTRSKSLTSSYKILYFSLRRLTVLTEKCILKKTQDHSPCFEI